ncbi:MAG: acetyl-coenzyme A synthetase N-terminal domain-containing protein, partial [Ruegeria sp.]
MGYRAEYDSWKADPEGWWMQAAEAIDWVTPPTRALSQRGDHLYDWFADAQVNTCWNAVDRHVE